ncbi:FAD-dependent oxidoreductase [Streptomyces sp. NBC_00342]|uniref:FAD-dependent oxidoreductase n=1 Tax=Streptomyces sp. NBC_00342 TaxID=2975718 RepID=UPI002E2C431D|nr:FAD-dependent oxidoreductase [Streptomyces sp. NBC_00342]
MNATEAQKHEVLVLGAGYAGLAAAIQLAARTRKRGDVRVTLVNPFEEFTERLRLHMTATGQETAEMSIRELLEGTGAVFVRGWVTALDVGAKTVRIDDDRVLGYDTLVYGLGSVADTVAVPGVDAHAHTLNSAQDAVLLADRLARLGGGTVVVAGSGLTGVEAAEEVAERYPEFQVTLLSRGEPGAGMHPRAKAHLDAGLARLGVRVLCGVEVTEVRPDSVELADGSSIGPWLPEPVLTGPATADGAAADSVSIALLVVLETLSPLERAVFVLKEVFAFSYAEIAEAVERAEPAVRQAAHRAREHVRARRPRFTTDRAVQRDVAERFFAAATGGDINALMELLSPDVTLWTDGGGKVRQALKPVVGLKSVAGWFAALGTASYQGVEPHEMRAEFTSINGGPGVVFHAPDRVLATMSFDFDPEGRISAIHNVANPDKLRAVTEGIRRELA